MILKEGYKLVKKIIYYYTKKNIIDSLNDSILTDKDGNVIETSLFQYHINSNLFSAVGKINRLIKCNAASKVGIVFSV